VRHTAANQKGSAPKVHGVKHSVANQQGRFQIIGRSDGIDLSSVRRWWRQRRLHSAAVGQRQLVLFVLGRKLIERFVFIGWHIIVFEQLVLRRHVI
jgi:hypothetical protein